MTTTPLLSVRKLRTGFAAADRVRTVVDDVSFELAAGETLALLGESGCGKSATALSLLRLLPETGRLLGGAVAFEGRELLALPEAGMRAVRGGGIGMIFQEPATSLNPVMTVGRQISEVLARHLGLVGKAARERTLELLEAVGIADAVRRLDEYPFQLSGGMKQRAMIAMALAGDPRLLIADEPTTALDVTIQAQILDLLRRLQTERGMGMLLITHDLGVVAQTAQRVAVMYAGEIVEEAPREAFFMAPQHPYTQKLFSALPGMARRGGQLETIAGQVPSQFESLSGCRFAARCPQAWPRCHAEVPAWHHVGENHRLRCHLPEAAARAVVSHAVACGTLPDAAAHPLPLLEVRDLCVYFPLRRGFLRRAAGFVRAVDGVSFNLGRARTLALVGESGCGKTSVGKAILQLIAPTSGSVQVHGRELSALSRRALRPLRRQLQMVFQDPFASLDPRLPVGEIIAEGMRAFAPAAGKGARQAAIAALLEQVGLEAQAMYRYPHEFSGGQRQRIAIARALAVQPELLVCDEPTSALDVSVQAQILNLLKTLQDGLGLAYLFITHNFAVVEYLAHEVAVMYLGRIVERGRVDEVLRAPQHPYTQALLAAVPDIGGGRDLPLMPLGGEMPSPAHPPAGCPFHPRCAQVRAECRSKAPPLLWRSPTHAFYCHLAKKF